MEHLNLILQYTCALCLVCSERLKSRLSSFLRRKAFKEAIVNVGSGDILNVRSGPSADYSKVSSFKMEPKSAFIDMKVIGHMYHPVVLLGM